MGQKSFDSDLELGRAACKAVDAGELEEGSERKINNFIFHSSDKVQPSCWYSVKGKTQQSCKR